MYTFKKIPLQLHFMETVNDPGGVSYADCSVMTAVIELIRVGVRCPRNHRTFSDQSFHRRLLFRFYTPPYHHHIQQ